MSGRVLVTGAAGRIGTSFWRSERTTYRLRLGDLHLATLSPSDCEVVELDITDAGSCHRACQDVETVLHLAADASPEAAFDASLLPINIVGAYNMFVAARDQGCKRFVFASSAQAIEGYPLDVQVHESMRARPKNLYGASKVFGEALASLFAEDGAMVTGAVRIGNVARFRAEETHSARDVAAFISERDVVQLLSRCNVADLAGFNVVHGVSDNRYKRLAIDATRRKVRYAPRDDAFAILESLPP